MVNSKASNKINNNFRKFITSSGKLVVAGKNAEQNEQVIRQAEANEIVLHTKSPGSPFCNIKAESKKASMKDIREAAVFCAAFSQAWKKARKKKDIEVHAFLGKDIYKDRDMKIGTFGVKKFKKIIIKKEEIEKLEKKNLMGE